MAPRVDVNDLALRIRSSERAALARGITLLESTQPKDRAQARMLLELLQADTPTVSSRRIGITGSPGAGKSTLIEAYGQLLLEEGKRVGVLAVDPSSNRTRGSILGDKTRMEVLSKHRGAFVRPSPAGTTLGGVARATRESILLLEAAGFDTILVETVGVGQSEHAVRDLVDAMMLLVLPGSGDDLQGIKRGIVELADIIVIHKSDGDRKKLAAATARYYSQALHLQSGRTDGWTPTTIQASSLEEGGLTGFGESLNNYFGTLENIGIQQLRRLQAIRYFSNAWRELASETLLQHETFHALLARLENAIASGTSTPERAQGELIHFLSQRFSAPRLDV